MSVELTPFRWPGVWKDPSALTILKQTPINCLVVDKGGAPDSVLTQAKQSGLTIVDSATPAAGILIGPGEWPGIQAPQRGADASAGPTGNAWIESNGWKVRLERMRRPQSAMWIDARPKRASIPADSYVLAFADSAVYGGRWIITLDDQPAAGLPQGNAQAAAAWKRMTDASRFFTGHAAWADMLPRAVVGIVSDFAGENEFMGQELLNLTARTNQQYRIILKDKLSPSSFNGLKALLYADVTPPGAVLKSRILAFVQAGGLLITGPKWGIAPGMRASKQDNDGYVWRTSGKGRIAFAKAEFDDPWTLAQEAVLLVSHRNDLLRFWNAGSVSAYYTAAPDGKRAVVHMLYYANRGPVSSLVRVVGAWRSAKLWNLDQSDPRPLEVSPQDGAVELQLPAISQYAALELEG